MKRSEQSVPVDLVVVGHVGHSEVRTEQVTHTSLGGSGFAVAATAASLIGKRVGLVAQVGPDLDLSPLRELGVNLDGVRTLRGTSPLLHIDQHTDGTRSFRSDLGVAAKARHSDFPRAYHGASYIHLGTAPPAQQLDWLRYLHSHGYTGQISADMFEHYVQTSPQACRKVCEQAAFVFMNKTEYEGLRDTGYDPATKSPLILKRGANGASIIRDGLWHDQDAQATEVVDPTGAGETLAGAFLALRSAGVPEEEAMRHAVRVATSCVEEFGVQGRRLVATLAAVRQQALPQSR